MCEEATPPVTTHGVPVVMLEELRAVWKLLDCIFVAAIVHEETDRSDGLLRSGWVSGRLMIHNDDDSTAHDVRQYGCQNYYKLAFLSLLYASTLVMAMFRCLLKL